MEAARLWAIAEGIGKVSAGRGMNESWKSEWQLAEIEGLLIECGRQMKDR